MDIKITGMKPGLSGIAAAALIAGLCGCGSSDNNAGSAATSTISTTPPSASEPSMSMSMSPGESMSMPPSEAPEPSTAAAKPVLITIKDFKFKVPGPVAPGAKVTVKNEDSEKHTLTSTTKGLFDVSADGRGGTATFTAPTKPGRSTFICTLHADMTGTLVVR